VTGHPSPALPSEPPRPASPRAPVTNLLLGVAEHLDIGNYQTDDEAVATMD
jgi:hypothetical protein